MLSSLTVHAADLELIPGRFLQRGEYAEQAFTLKNNSKRHFDAVYGECGIFDGDELIATSNLDFHDIPPKGEAYSFANSDRGHVSEIKCRITNIE
jgi:hypothetical protein